MQKPGPSARRNFLKLAGSTALSMAAGSQLISCNSPSESQPTPQSKVADTHPPLKMPDGFKWGVATSAYQIEGAYNEDGKGPSIWDKYAHIPGKMKHGDTGDMAIDHYHRYKEDIQLIKSIGANAYRFSISWPRIFPDGKGTANQKGLDFYKRLTEELLAAGIEPYATLYHWDLPQALQDKYGGWQSGEIPKAFAEYAGYMAQHLGDKVKNFFTINEFQSFVEMGHRGVDMMAQGKSVRIELAPGLKLEPADLNQVRHHAVLAHGLAVQAIRAMGKPGTRIGPAEVMYTAIPAIDTPENIRAAELATRQLNAPYLAVMLEGKYSDDYLKAAGSNAPKFTDKELQVIGSPVDFVGINVYIPAKYVVASDNELGYSDIPFNASHPKMDSPWHQFSPEVLYWAPKLLHTIWGPKAIYITENGCAAKDVLAPDGKVYDTDRIMYLRNGLTHLHRACTENAPIKGNFVWSAMDNLEWTGGYETRFGLIYVDFNTLKRTPKLSAAWFREAATRNAVV